MSRTLDSTRHGNHHRVRSRAAAATALIVLVVALVCAQLAGCKRCSDEPWVARIQSIEGQVRVAVAADAEREPAEEGQLLQVGSRVETGADGAAHLALKSGGTLAVEPNSVVVFEGDQGEQSSLVLEQGQVVGTGSDVEASMLVIEVGGRIVSIGPSGKAKVVAGSGAEQAPRVFMILGSASVETPDGKRREMVEGDVLVLGPVEARADAAVDATVDAGADAEADARILTAEELTYYVTLERGRVRVKNRDERRFSRLRRRRPVPIGLGTELRLARRAVVSVDMGTDEPPTKLRGPSEFLVREGRNREDGQPTLAFESQSTEQTISLRGKRGDKGPRFLVQGVRLSTFVTHREIDVRIKQEDEQATVKVNNGAVELVGKNKEKVRVEAGQQAILNDGAVKGPSGPAKATLKLDKPGALRVFVASRRAPVTLEWTRPADTDGALVEISRRRSFQRPLFADVITRRALTVDLPRGEYYWRVRPMGKDGSLGEPSKGQIALLRDTSYQRLKDRRPPNNTIREDYGNTTVFYQNALPNFTFRWKPVQGAARYTMKLFREGNLTKPLFKAQSKRSSMRLSSGRLREGTYLWYVAARDRAGELIETTESRRLQIRYDNATPNLQIVYPRNGVVVSKETVMVRGITIRGSKVYINGVAAELDESFRFEHSVPLKAGPNDIIFRVVDKRTGSTLYLRRVVRR
jgi:hypothetical protein